MLLIHGCKIKFFSSLFTLVLLGTPGKIQAKIQDSLIVHEWGTFTSLSTSSGELLSGLYQDASRLPSFVYGLPFFNYDTLTGWPDPNQLKNVTIKMETPILYFYSKVARNIEVTVDFMGGTISQWFPQRNGGELNPSGSVNFATPYAGKINWKAKVLSPSFQYTATGRDSVSTQEWLAPRNTASNFVQIENGEVERFLFYRGLGNFELPLKSKFMSDGRLRLTNDGNAPISHIFIYVMPRDTTSLPHNYSYSEPAVWWSGPLDAGKTIFVSSKPPSDSKTRAGIETLRSKMIAAGLRSDETGALLDTWQYSYFESEKGFKIFWIVPRAFTDKILPLQIKPTPDKLERVIIGRSEILTPEFEHLLMSEYSAGRLDKFRYDKYYFAYLDFVEKTLKAQVTSGLSGRPKAIPRHPQFNFGVDILGREWERRRRILE